MGILNEYGVTLIISDRDGLRNVKISLERICHENYT